MADAPQLQTHEFPGPQPLFKCTVGIPGDWQPVPLPPEEVDFSNPTTFLPVGVAMAKYAAIVFSIAVRPRFPEGSVGDWLMQLAKEHGYEPLNPTVDKIGNIDVVACMAEQPSDAGKMLLRVHMFEDAGYIWNVSVMSPQPLFESLVPTFQAMLASFKVANRMGATAPLTPGASIEPLKKDDAEESKTSAPPQQSPEKSPDKPAKKKPAAKSSAKGAKPEAKSEAKPKGKKVEVKVPEEPPVPASAEKTYADLSLAGDMSSLDQDKGINQRFRDNGIGLVPRVIATDEKRRFATLGAGAILAKFNVPFGWHVMDDGKRVLVFDAGNKIQINMNLFDPENASDDEVLDQILAQITQRTPSAENIRLDLGGQRTLGVRGIVEDGQALEQAFMLRRGAPRGLTMLTRITAVPEDVVRAVDLAGLIHRDMAFA